ncbi:MAG: DNA polymerase III subunit gamma/tau [Candidatus Kapaibacteriales bacterium]
MSFIVTARKWRPLRFDEVVGQEHITTTLKNAFQIDRIHHAYLFSGPRGTGKTTIARIFARLVNCKNPKDTEPCNKCDSCQSILEGHSLDVLEIDGASNNSIDDVRTLRENAKYPPSLGKYKIYIIDEVHMLSISAFNALLKILEEPPKHLIFIFATTEPHKVPLTIQSRCQRFGFRRLEIETIKNQISKIAKVEDIRIDEQSLFTIAKKADGSMRDAQSLFDQFVANAGKVISYQNIKDTLHLIDDEFYFKVSEAYLNRDVKVAFVITDEIVRSGYEFSEFLSGLIEHFRNLLVIKSTNNPSLLFVPENLREQFIQTANKFDSYDLIRIMNLITQTEQQIKFLSNPRFRIELLLTQIIEMPNTADINQLLKKIDELKSISTSNLTFNDETQEKFQLKSLQSKIVSSLPSKSSLDEPNPEITSNTWDAFLAKYGKQLNGLQTYTENGIIEVKISSNEVLILVFNKFAYDNLESKSNQIRSKIREFFGNNFSVKIILVERDISTTEDNTKYDLKPTKQITLDPATQKEKYEKKEETAKFEESQLAKKIKELFKAKEIPLE